MNNISQRSPHSCWGGRCVLVRIESALDRSDVQFIFSAGLLTKDYPPPAVLLLLIGLAVGGGHPAAPDKAGQDDHRRQVRRHSEQVNGDPYLQDG